MLQWTWAVWHFRPESQIVCWTQGLKNDKYFFLSCFCKNAQRKQEAQSQWAVSEYNSPFKRAEEKRNKECASSGVWCFASKLTWEISPLFYFCIRNQFKALIKWNFAEIPLSTIRRLEFWWASKSLDSSKMSSLYLGNISVYSAIDQLIVFLEMSLGNKPGFNRVVFWTALQRILQVFGGWVCAHSHLGYGSVTSLTFLPPGRIKFFIENYLGCVLVRQLYG